MYAEILFLASLALIAVGTGGCSTSSSLDTTAVPSVHYMPARLLSHDRGFYIAGQVPQLRHAGGSEAALNERLRSVAEQGISRAEKAVRPTSGLFAGGGEFTIDPVMSLISANSVFVSALLPASESRPHGTSSHYWLSVTFEVSSPKSTIGISGVITEFGFHRLAKAVKAKLERNTCVTKWAPKGDLLNATAPRAASFRQFAMLPAGLAVGFPSSPNGPLYECGEFEVVIPYSELAGAMSPAGKALAKRAAER